MRHSFRRPNAGAHDTLFAMANQSNETLKRREIYFSGRVQGVGFRYITRDIAARFDVVGFVKNLADGRVLLIVEGTPPALDRFIDTLATHMAHYIQTAETSTSPAKNEFTHFEIRH